MIESWWFRAQIDWTRDAYIRCMPIGLIKCGETGQDDGWIEAFDRSLHPSSHFLQRRWRWSQPSLHRQDVTKQLKKSCRRSSLETTYGECADEVN